MSNEYSSDFVTLKRLKEKKKDTFNNIQHTPTHTYIIDVWGVGVEGNDNKSSL